MSGEVTVLPSAALAARLLVSSRLGEGLFNALPDECRPATELDAYLVQQAARPLLESAGFGRQSGWKIGCTTPVMQAHLGIDGPCAGAMFRANTWSSCHDFVLPTA